ncbi:S8 family serine peptidase, partial [Yinghuangia sp. YIM S09857]|uniref:S8 family serine peptidase n=1 Tax=Yinghuangia sp. YIM S09857 TaxID=3436929 RepID=UPI003F53C04E
MNRRARRRFVAGVVAGALLAVGAVGTGGAQAASGPGSGPPAAGPPGSGPAGAQPSRASVTLITGDVVTVDTFAGGTQAVTATPAPGREDVSFLRSTRNGSVTVVPSDALALLNRGVLDPALFDVTGLVRDGFDDRRTPVLPLIVRYEGPGTAAARSSVAASSVPGRELPSIQAQAVAERKADAGAFWRTVAAGPADAGTAKTAAPGIARIWLDGRVRASLDRSVPQIGAPQAWQAGLTGAGVRTAVLDSGIDPNHPDLSDAVAASADFTGDAVGPIDRNGHGTHVASIITGSGAASRGRYAGVAPDTRLVVGKVLDDTGWGTYSQIVAGMEWAVGQQARVVNMSLGSGASDGTDPMSQAVDALSASSGALFVIAAGNDGAPGSVSAPSTANSALSVGSVDAENRRAPSSSQGPRDGDHAAKPEITAPGVGIGAARAADTWRGEPIDDFYTRLGGTSMATPHVAGAAAILAQQHPDWTGERIKEALVGSTAPGPDMGVFEQGTGRVDVAAAVTRTVSASPAALSTYLRWPSTEPVERTVVYRNDGDAPLVLDLAVVSDSAMPLRLGATRVTVPPHGTAPVSVTVDPAAGEAGTYGGVLVASGPDGQALVRTALSVFDEPEVYDLRVKAVDRNGAALDGGAVVVVDVDSGVEYDVRTQGEFAVARVPKGRYSVDAMVLTPATDTRLRSWTLVSLPDTAVDADTTLVADARGGLPAGVSLDRQGTTVEHRRLGYAETFAGGGISGIEASFYNLQTEAFAVPQANTGAQYAYRALAFLAKPASGGQPAASFNLAQAHEGAIPPNPTLSVRTAELAAVDSRVHTMGDHEPVTAVMSRLAGWGDGSFGGWFHSVPLPGTARAYLSVQPGLSWQSVLQTDGWMESGAARTYPAGRTSTEDWNEAPPSPWVAFGRCGDDGSAGIRAFNPSGAGRVMEGGAAWGRVTLSRNGEEVASSEDVFYPYLPGMAPEKATYALRLEAERDDPMLRLGSRVDATWTFSSVRPPDGGCDAG